MQTCSMALAAIQRISNRILYGMQSIRLKLDWKLICSAWVACCGKFFFKTHGLRATISAFSLTVTLTKIVPSNRGMNYIIYVFLGFVQVLCFSKNIIDPKSIYRRKINSVEFFISKNFSRTIMKTIRYSFVSKTFVSKFMVILCEIEVLTITVLVFYL